MLSNRYRYYLLGAMLLVLNACSVTPPAPTEPTERPASRAGTVIDPATPAPPTTPAISQPTAIAAQAPEPADLWQELRKGFALSGSEQPGVARHLSAHKRNPLHVNTVIERSTPYLAWIFSQVAERGFPAELALLPMVESGFQATARSPDRAAGLWQIMPATGRHLGLTQDRWYDGRMDVNASTAAALDYLAYLHRRFDGDWLLALAAYNAGEGRVASALRKNRAAGKPLDYWHLELPRETRLYIPKLLALRTLIETPYSYGIQLPPLATRPQLELVDAGGQIELAVAARLARLPVEDLQRYNRGYRQWATPPQGPHTLLLPFTVAERLTAALAELPANERMRYQRHRIREGETLSHIAQRYDTRVSVLRDINRIKGSRIRAGKELLIPVAGAPVHHAGAQTAAQAIHHEVRAGDNLWDLARRYEVQVDQLTNWNGLSRNSILRPGQRLLIAGDRVRPATYQVQPGDSLSTISARFKVKLRDLRNWNRLHEDAYIHPGQELRLTPGAVASST